MKALLIRFLMEFEKNEELRLFITFIAGAMVGGMFALMIVF